MTIYSATMLAGLCAALMAQQTSAPGIKSGTTTAMLKNSAGLDLSHAVTNHEFGLIYKLATSASIMDGWFAFDGPRYDRAAFLAYAAEVRPGLRARYNYASRPGRKAGGDFSAKIAANRESGSFLPGSRKTAMRFMRDRASRRAPAPPLSYIENGVLKAPFCDKKTAQKFGFTPSGSAYAAYDGAPETGPSCAAIKPGAQTIKEMLGGQSAVFVAMASGGDFTSQGGFGTPAQLAFLLKDGKLVGKLPELQLSSSVYEMYGPGFLGVSSDTVMPLSTHHWLGFMMDVRKG